MSTKYKSQTDTSGEKGALSRAVEFGIMMATQRLEAQVLQATNQGHER